MSSTRQAASAASAGGSRKRPRHFQQGPDEAEEEQREEEAAAAQPPSARLYRHALESIFGFLSLLELHQVLAVSRLWSSAVRSMHSIGASFPLPYPRGISADDMETLATTWLSRLHPSSPLLRHIDTLGDASAPLYFADIGVQLPPVMMQQLRCLRLRLLMPLRCFFPPSLTHLEVNLCDRFVNPSPLGINSMILSLALNIPTLTTLSLQMNLPSPRLDFAPLARLPNLTKLKLNKNPRTLAQLTQLRALKQLTILDVSLAVGSIQQFLSLPGDQPRLASLSVCGPLSPDVCALLALVPSLTHFSSNGATDLSFLRSLPNLRQLELHFLFEEAATPSPSELSGMMEEHAGRRPGLTSLRLFGCVTLTSAHMEALLECMPNLQSLRIEWLESVEILRFLKTVAASLTDLSIEFFQLRLKASDLLHVLALPQLQRLALIECMSEELDSQWQEALSPPSALLPKLTHSDIKVHHG